MEDECRFGNGSDVSKNVRVGPFTIDNSFRWLERRGEIFSTGIFRRVAWWIFEGRSKIRERTDLKRKIMKGRMGDEDRWGLIEGEEKKKIYCEIYGEILNKFWNGFYEIKFDIKGL